MVDIECFGATDIGQRRATNQDHFVVGDLQKHMGMEYSSVSFESPKFFGQPMGKLMLVADGMGGANAGEVASELAIKSTVEFLLNSMHWLYNPSEPEVEKFVKDLKNAACFSHQLVRDDADGEPAKRGMGSTLTVAYVVWPMLYLLHVGDSRCYLWHQKRLSLLTKDQTFAQYLFDHGSLSESEFEASPYHNVLISAIGIDDQPVAAVYRQRLDYGDRIMLCSDGVNRHLDDQAIGDILSSDANSKSMCDQVISRANELGGEDNITAVIAKFQQPS